MLELTSKGVEVAHVASRRKGMQLEGGWEQWSLTEEVYDATGCVKELIDASMLPGLNFGLDDLVEVFLEEMTLGEDAKPSHVVKTIGLMLEADLIKWL